MPGCSTCPSRQSACRADAGRRCRSRGQLTLLIASRASFAKRQTTESLILRPCVMPLRTKKTWWGVSLDAPDPWGLAEFYTRLLGWKLFPDPDGPGAAVAPSADAGFNLTFQRELHYARPIWPAVQGQPQMSMHLDIEVDDLEEAVAYALEVGAELADFQPQATVRVMFDPAGHPFCLYLEE